MLSRERRLFFLRWLSNPWCVGVPVPSSKGLCRAMASQLSDIGENEYVLELGPGTGVVTRALLQAGVDPKRLVMLEYDHGFIAKLKHDFPETTVVQGDARNLQEVLHKHGIHQVAAVVSSLPLLAMSHEMRHEIVNAAFKVLKRDGAYIQYTYGFVSPVPKKYQRSIGIRGRVAKRIWVNFPPARVWRYTSETEIA